MTLTSDVREALMDACPATICPSVGDYDELFAAVERLLDIAKGEALVEAADALGDTALTSFWDAVRWLDTRASAAASAPSLSSEEKEDR